MLTLKPGPVLSARRRPSPNSDRLRVACPPLLLLLILLLPRLPLLLLLLVVVPYGSCCQLPARSPRISQVCTVRASRSTEERNEVLALKPAGKM